MSRFSVLAGSVAFLVISGVNAGPCRPSSSVISSGLETATTSIEVAEPTTTLLSTLTTETEVSETLSVTIASTEGVTTTEASDTAHDTTTTEAATTEMATTTEAATTAETTTALATTSAAPAPVPVRNHECKDLVSPYMAPNGASYNFDCNTSPSSYFPVDFYDVTSFEQCLFQCSLSSDCRGVVWEQASFFCGSFSSADGSESFLGVDVAYKIEV
ncbi:uncharacterized protein FIESC28_10734 [Fusarium coffeatum]|uniref:Apple domain-containing protein n=1 Tax=Fusarium coffeatum TaxID=231269 RepID=A0A366QTD2_9HYPO|nr:uncharacterized protein FIESC28_10734 [Fusarium coffeatum]RBR07235.1 hypothetical protein FIESC28_10734 [Fusarium coffeatum]